MQITRHVPFEHIRGRTLVVLASILRTATTFSFVGRHEMTEGGSIGNSNYFKLWFKSLENFKQTADIFINVIRRMKPKSAINLFQHFETSKDRFSLKSGLDALIKTQQGGKKTWQNSKLGIIIRSNRNACVQSETRDVSDPVAVYTLKVSWSNFVSLPLPRPIPISPWSLHTN